MNSMIWSLNTLLLTYSTGLFCQELQNDFPEKCLEDLGCYRTGYPFYELPHRFLTLLPFHKEYIDTTFLLFTPQNPVKAEIIQDSRDYSSEGSFFNPALPVKVIIPGFMSTIHQNDSNHMMKNILLLCAPYNVIIVDWSSSNKAPYPQAIANARVVATQLSNLINRFITESGILPKSVHLIGHSLGAHLAGWAGSQIQNLGRITGLDPAGPMFYEAHPEVKLDATDAVFVDVIHTNGGKKYAEGLGLEETIGDLDFYPNGGIQQPGCFEYVQEEFVEEDADKNVGFRGNNTCSHARAVELFIESILNDKCRFIGVACNSYTDFIGNKCGKRARKAEMGLHSKMPFRNPPGLKFYLKTGGKYPHAICE